MGTSLIVRVRPEGVELTQAAIQQLGKAVAQAARDSSAAATAAAASHATDLGDRYSHASLRITEAMSRVAASGDIVGHSMNSVVANASEMAFAFGEGGPVVAALAVAGLAVARFFAQSREEIDKTIQKIQEMQYTGNHQQGIATLRELYQGAPGTPSLGELQARQSLAGPALNTFLPGLGGLASWWFGRDVADRQETIERAKGQVLNPWITPPQIGLPPVKITGKQHEDFIPPMDLWSEKELVAQFRAALRDREESIHPKWADGPGVEGRSAADQMVKEMGEDLVKSVQAMFDGGEGVKIMKALEKRLKDVHKQMKWEEVKQDFSKGIASAVSGGLAAGIQAAVATGSLSQAFGHLGQFITAQMGTVLADVALKAIGFAELMAQFETWLIANPWAAVGIGVAMVALANAFKSGGSVGGGGGGYGGGYGSYGGAVGAAETTRIVWGADSAGVAAGMSPRSATNVVVIGPNDPVAQRGILELIKNANRRGG